MLRAEVFVGDGEYAALAGAAATEFDTGIALLYKVLRDFGRRRGRVDAVDAVSAAEAGGGGEGGAAGFVVGEGVGLGPDEGGGEDAGGEAGVGGLEDLLDAAEGVEGTARGVGRGVRVAQQHDVREAVQAREAGGRGAGRGRQRRSRPMRRAPAHALHHPLQLRQRTTVLHCSPDK